MLDIDTMMDHGSFVATLDKVDGLRQVAREVAEAKTPEEELVMMEFIVEGLHQNFLLTKRIRDARIRYTDAVSYMMNELTD